MGLRLWLWTAVLAVVATIAGLAELLGGRGVSGLVVSALLWTVVVGGWWLLRWRARRRFTPRRLPTRRRGR